MEDEHMNASLPRNDKISIIDDREYKTEVFTVENDVSPIYGNSSLRYYDENHANKETTIFSNKPYKQNVVLTATKAVGTSQTEDDVKYLTREDLLELDNIEPIWKKIRWGVLITTIIILCSLGLSTIILIITGKRCPTIPLLSFHQEDVGYWLNVQGFIDTNGDGVGDIKGLTAGIDYIQNKLGAGFIIIDNLLKGEFTNGEKEKLGIISSFDEIDPIVGEKKDLANLLKMCHKRNIKVMISIDVGSIYKDNNITNTENNLIVVDTSSNTTGRNGLSANYKCWNKTCFGTDKIHMFHLNLSSMQVLSYIKKAMRIYLDMQVDGFLLKNVALYHPEYFTEGKQFTNSNNSWFKAFPDGMLYTNKSVEFIKFFTEFIKETLTKYGKQRVIMIDPGNTGYGTANNEELGLKYLNATNVNIQLVGRQFVKYRGWKAAPINDSWMQSSFENYFKEVGNYSDKIALATGTPSDIGDEKLTSVASVLLLPGSPIVFAGTEIAVPLKISRNPPREIYPKGKVLFPDLNDRDTTVPIQVPMPWSKTGEGFSSNESLSKYFHNYLEDFNITDTVQLATAANRALSRFSIFKTLIRLRKEHPSLKWGKVEAYRKHITPTAGEHVEVFVRKAEGFPAVAVVLNNPGLGNIHHFDGISLQFGEFCEKMNVLFVYAKDSHINMGDVLDASNIYIEKSKTESIFVFVCLS